mmetsp:Transcript_10195/g.13334  ORF Transcript_10195/g.13334 Transcript_10195/m.13334 type:complete len:80 (+) Transcript_10195:893-1132(+)
MASDERAGDEVEYLGQPVLSEEKRRLVAAEGQEYLVGAFLEGKVGVEGEEWVNAAVEELSRLRAQTRDQSQRQITHHHS